MSPSHFYFVFEIQKAKGKAYNEISLPPISSFQRLVLVFCVSFQRCFMHIWASTCTFLSFYTNSNNLYELVCMLLCSTCCILERAPDQCFRATEYSVILWGLTSPCGVWIVSLITWYLDYSKHTFYFHIKVVSFFFFFFKKLLCLRYDLHTVTCFSLNCLYLYLHLCQPSSYRTLP